MRYRQDVLRERFPELAKAFEEVLNRNPALGNRLRYVYYPGYRTSSRKDKTLTLQRIIEEVEKAGYNIEIKLTTDDPLIPSI
jgi:hypothetical protein